MAESNRNINWSPTVVLFALIVALGGFGFLITGNIARKSTPSPTTVPQAVPTYPLEEGSPEDTSLKQGTFTFEFPTSIPDAPSVCGDQNLVYDDEGSSNRNSNIFIALDPPKGESAGNTGVIRAWASDEAGGRFPDTASVDSNGIITSHSNALIDLDSHGYPWEPSIYITQITAANINGPYSGDKENGGSPYFPTSAKGEITPKKGSGWLNVPPMDDPLPYRIGTRAGDGSHVAEFIWDVPSLNLAPGSYRIQVALHDGDSHLAIECTTISI